MALELKQNLKLSQQLVMTPQLQQAIKLLQLNRMELLEVINQEIVENPVLEETGEQEETDDPNSANLDPEQEQKRDEEASQKKDQEELLSGKDDFNWDAYIEEFNSNSSSTAPSMKEVAEELPSFENVLTKTSTIEEHLRWQLSMVTMADNERKLGELILGNLSEVGYLAAELEDLARESKIDIEDAEEVLKIIQKFDPIGVASRNLKECLSIQASFMDPKQPLVDQIIENHLGDLEKKNFPKIIKALGVSLDEAINATKLILEFEPKPARSFESSNTQYITPDIYVYKVGNEYNIVLNEDGMPKLRISSYYKSILSSKEKNKDTREYVQEKMRAAIWLIKSIHNRQKTIFKVTDAIVKRQRDFFDEGAQKLKPMILKDVANDIGMHESTISRVTTNKYVHTPIGIFELKYFFNSSIQAADGGDQVASEAVKEKIKKLIAKEDPKKPLSDQKIVELLKSSNVDIARRTVAKYRDMLGILSSGKRKKLF